MCACKTGRKRWLAQNKRICCMDQKLWMKIYVFCPFLAKLGKIGQKPLVFIHNFWTMHLEVKIDIIFGIYGTFYFIWIRFDYLRRKYIFSDFIFEIVTSRQNFLVFTKISYLQSFWLSKKCHFRLNIHVGQKNFFFEIVTSRQNFFFY